MSSRNPVTPMRLHSLALLALATPAFAQQQAAPLPTAPITEWETPWPKDFIRDPVADDQGRVWFCGMNGNFIGLFEPGTGKFRRFELPAGTHPHNVIVDRQGRAWLSGNRNGTINRIDPASGVVTPYKLPEGLADPHTLALDSRDDIWFTVQNGNAVGKLDTKSGMMRVVKLPTPSARPYGIVVDERDRPWFTEFGTNKVGTVDPVTFALREFTMPNADSRPRRIALSGGQVYVDDYPRGTLVRLDPANGNFSEFALPSGKQSLPYAMASDDKGLVWIAETGVRPNQLIAFDTKLNKVVNVTPVRESGGITIRHMTFDPRTKLIWFATDAGTVGKLAVAGGGAEMRP
jgi:virginiamycin B lyase